MIKGKRVKTNLGNEDVNSRVLVIPTKLVDSIPSSKHHLVPKYVFSVLAPS